MCSIEVTDIRSIENFWQDKQIFYSKQKHIQNRSISPRWYASDSKRTANYTDILSTIPAILHLKSMNDSSSENTKS